MEPLLRSVLIVACMLAVMWCFWKHPKKAALATLPLSFGYASSHEGRDVAGAFVGMVAGATITAVLVGGFRLVRWVLFVWITKPMASELDPWIAQVRANAQVREGDRVTRVAPKPKTQEPVAARPVSRPVAPPPVGVLGWVAWVFFYGCDVEKRSPIDSAPKNK